MNSVTVNYTLFAVERLHRGCLVLVSSKRQLAINPKRIVDDVYVTGIQRTVQFKAVYRGSSFDEFTPHDIILNSGDVFLKIYH